MKATTLTPAQLAELQNCLQRINDILGLSITISDAHATHRSSACPRKRTTPRVTNATFTYRWLTNAPQRITTLYQYLLRAQWIAADTQPDDFFTLFTGKASNIRIKWTGSNLQLAYLIRVMTERNYISTPKRVGKWTCVYNHFVDKNSRQLPRLNSLHIPTKSKLAVEQMAELLNPNT
ncbi:MAG: hypothetical protein IJX48_02005 [Paludibacteraceae bacterium]|nr:hypothetical protein [Paludibacteraceae bacterium]